VLYSGSQLLRRSVLLRGVRLGEVEDVLLDARGRRVLGLVVLCGDGARRMLPLSAAEVHPRESVSVSSALVLMDDGYYRGRTRTFSSLLDAAVRRGAVAIGTLADVLFDDGGRVRLVDVEGLGEISVDDGLAIDPEVRAAAN
jgi:sporulation protein YlmC with PRC-barrel domain